MKCALCMCKVYRFNDQKWKPHIDIMFFIKEQPENFIKVSLIKDVNLIQGLDAAPNFSAYACKCAWISLNEVTAKAASSNNWACTGDHAL